MKRVCKGVDIEDRGLIVSAVYDCLRKAKKRRRGDTRRLFARLLHIGAAKARRALRERGDLYHEGVQKIADMLREMIRSRRLKLRPVYQRQRRDPGSGKIRKISILSIEQLLLDHVAVAAMDELARRVGEYQVSSIRKRGGEYGRRAIERWLRKRACKYAAKLDIRDFYGSIKRPQLLKWLHRHIKNAPLLWLIGQLVYTVPEGIAIGSYLSQTLANIYLSDLYHRAMERCRSKRGARQVEHALFYMDDMLIVGRNKRQLRFAGFSIMQGAGDLGLQVKANWHVFKIEILRPVDMMGFRFAVHRTTLRKRVFVPARRSILRCGRAARKGAPVSLCRARRVASYHGNLTAANCRLFLTRTRAHVHFTQAFQRISHGKNKIHK